MPVQALLEERQLFSAVLPDLEAFDVIGTKLQQAIRRCNRFSEFPIGYGIPPGPDCHHPESLMQFADG